MSRTFRCKNYEDTQNTSWDRQGRKIGGFYCEYSYANEVYDSNLHWGWRYVHIFRPPTQEELIKAYWRNHGESRHRCARSPSRYHRGTRMAENRRINNQELHKFLKNPDHEPMLEANPRNCWWDWS
jgi:hypothetical protein